MPSVSKPHNVIRDPGRGLPAELQSPIPPDEASTDTNGSTRELSMRDEARPSGSTRPHSTEESSTTDGTPRRYSTDQGSSGAVSTDKISTEEVTPVETPLVDQPDFDHLLFGDIDTFFGELTRDLLLSFSTPPQPLNTVMESSPQRGGSQGYWNDDLGSILLSTQNVGPSLTVSGEETLLSMFEGSNTIETSEFQGTSGTEAPHVLEEIGKEPPSITNSAFPFEGQSPVFPISSSQALKEMESWWPPEAVESSEAQTGNAATGTSEVWTGGATQAATTRESRAENTLSSSATLIFRRTDAIQLETTPKRLVVTWNYAD